MIDPHSPARAVLAFLLVAAASVSSSVAQEPNDQLEEEIHVLESRITLDFTGMSTRAVSKLTPRDIIVLEGGAAREVTSLTPLSRAGQWRTVIYVDAPLTRAKTVRTATLALGEFVESLSDLGAVEIIVADPDPRPVLAPTQRAPVLEEALARVASLELDADLLTENRKAFRRIETPTAEQAGSAAATEIALIRRQADHLLHLASTGGDGLPSVLFLISDGYFEQPGAHYFGTADEYAQTVDEAATRISTEVAQTLAAYEWTVIALPLREKEINVATSIRPTTGFQTFVDDIGGIRLQPKASERRVADLSLDDLELRVSPILRPLNRLAAETAGEAIRVRTHLGAGIERLLGRVRAYYLTDRLLDGTLRSTSAVFSRTRTPQARSRTGVRRIRAPAWARASTPTATVEARLRSLLRAELDNAAALPLVAAFDSSSRLALEVDWGSLTELAEGSVTRLSLATQSADGEVRIRHVLVEGSTDAVTGLSSYTADLPTTIVTRPLAIILEALRSGTWAIATIEEL